MNEATTTPPLEIARSPKPPRRWGPIVVWTLFLLPIPISLFVLVENWRAERAWAELVTEFEKRGDKLDLASVIPPEIPEAENFAAAPVFRPLFDDPAALGAFASPLPPGTPNGPDALAALKEIKYLPSGTSRTGPGAPLPGNWRGGTVTDLVPWQTTYRASSDYPQTPESQTPGKDVLKALSKFDPQINGMREAALRPKCRFPLSYELGAGIKVPHVTFFLGISQVLTVRASAALAEGDAAAAAADLLLISRCTEALADEPILISWLVRLACTQLTFQPLWEGLVHHHWSEEQLLGFEQALSRQDFVASHRLALRGERNIYLVPLLHKSAFSRLQAVSGPFGPPESFRDRVIMWALPSAWYDRTRIAAVRHMEAWRDCEDPVAKTIDRTHLTQLTSQSITPHGPAWLAPPGWVSRMFFELIPNTFAKGAQVQGRANLARIAIALERHRLRHGEYPLTLADLDPDIRFVDGKTPTDVVNGTPAHYHRQEDGSFLLYYDGWNGKDDGGTIIWNGPRPDFEQGDMVWPSVEKKP